MNKKVFLIGASSSSPLIGQEPLLIRGDEIEPAQGELFKEAAASLLWKKRGHSLLLRASHLPTGASFLETIRWLDQEAPREACLLLPLQELPLSLLPIGGSFVPLVEKGEPPLLLYSFLRELEPFVRGVALVSLGFTERELALLADPFREKKGALSYLPLSEERLFHDWKAKLVSP